MEITLGRDCTGSCCDLPDRVQWPVLVETHFCPACASEHVDNLGAHTASRPETGLPIPSDFVNRLLPCKWHESSHYNYRIQGRWRRSPDASF